MHTRVGYCLWWYLYRIDCIRRFIPTPPNRPGRRAPAGYMTRAVWEWKVATSEHNRRFCGPRTEHDSPYDDRWPLTDHDMLAWAEVKRQKAYYRALGYTWVRG